MFHVKYGRTLRYNMRPRQPREPSARLIWVVLAFLASLLLAWKIFRWIAL